MNNISSRNYVHFGTVFTFSLLFFQIVTISDAQAVKLVRNPYVVEGELELEWKGAVSHDNKNAKNDGAWEQQFAVAYGVTNNIQLELEGRYEDTGDSKEVNFKDIELETKIQLTEPGQYWVDTGIFVEYERNFANPDKIEAKLLLAKDTGNLSHLANIALEHEIGSGAGNGTEFGFSLSSRYRYSRSFEPGVEMHSSFGEIGNVSEFNKQKHMIGPVAYGKIGAFKYDIGYLTGISDAAPDGTFKAILEYEWHF